MSAKRFFYICVGLLLLATASHLSSRPATAQQEPTVVALLPVGPGGAVVDSSGRFYWRDIAGVWHLSPTQAPPGTPVDVKFFFAERENGQVYWLAMANGDVYTWPDGWNPATPWEFNYAGNVFAGTVGIDGTTWGTVKRGYRQ